jgi:hypothetical protein
MDRVTANVGHLGVEAGDLLCALLVLARPSGTPTAFALKSTQFPETTFESARVGEFSNHFVNSGDRRQTSHAHIDTNHRI